MIALENLSITFKFSTIFGSVVRTKSSKLSNHVRSVTCWVKKQSCVKFIAQLFRMRTADLHTSR